MRLEAILDTATRSHSRALLVLVTASLLSFLPGFFTIPPVDRDEPRFAQATKQMIESGDHVNIRFQDQTRFKKPIGIYWLQSAAVETARAAGVRNALTTIWLYRLPSLFGAIGAVCLTYWAAIALASRRAAVLAGLMIASCVLLGVEARLAKTDAMLLLATVATMGGLARVYLSAHGRLLSTRQEWSVTAVVWTALAVGVLVKGPVIVLVAGLCATTLAIRDRSVRWIGGLRPVAGVIWFSAITLPWFVTVLSQPRATLIAESVSDIFPRVFRSVEGHGASPGYYLLLFWVAFWPGSTLAGLAAPAIWTSRREPAIAFLLAWLVPSWVVFELVITKLPHYVLPLYPCVAILIAGVVDHGQLSQRLSLIRAAALVFVVPLIVGTLALGAMIAIGPAGQPARLTGGSLIVAAVLVAFAGWRRLATRDATRAVLSSTFAAVLLSGAVFGIVLPRLRPIFPSAIIAEALLQRGCAHPLVVTSLTYNEPSLVFLAGAATRATTAAGAVAFLGEGPCRFAFVDAADADDFRRAAEAARVRYVAGRTVDGINISKGTAMKLLMFWSGGPS